MEAIVFAGFLFVGLLTFGTDANPQENTLRVQRGDTARLPCKLASGMDTDNVLVHWKSSKDSYITSGTRVLKYVNQIEVVKTTTREWNLLIKSVADSFAANYTCTANQDVLLSNVQLMILVAPKIVYDETSSSEVSVNEGGTVELTCAFTGEPVPSITWLRGDGDDKQPTGITGRKLIIRDVNRYVTDVYTCRGKNSISYGDYSINVIVMFPVEVEVMEKTIHAKTGGVFTLLCLAQGEPMYDTYWVDAHGEKVKESSWKNEFEVESAGAHVPAKFVTLVTRKGTFTRLDFGTFTCEAKGEGNVAKATVEVVELKDSRQAAPANTNGNVIKYD